jgi:hypothetical protein
LRNDIVEDHLGAPPKSWAAPFRKALSLRGREGFLSTLSSSPGIGAWQVEQAADALTILLGSVFGQE